MLMLRKHIQGCVLEAFAVAGCGQERDLLSFRDFGVGASTGS